MTEDFVANVYPDSVTPKEFATENYPLDAFEKGTDEDETLYLLVKEGWRLRLGESKAYYQELCPITGFSDSIWYRSSDRVRFFHNFDIVRAHGGAPSQYEYFTNTVGGAPADNTDWNNTYGNIPSDVGWIQFYPTS